MQFYIDYSVDELWRCAFKDGDDAVRKVKLAGKNGNKYHDTVVDTFVGDYEGSTKLKIPDGYYFPYPPTLMQRYVAYKVTNLPYFGNFSGTGAGKTLSAILASRVIDSKVTVIVCPNDVVEQWKRNILDTFPSSKVITGKGAFDVQYLKKEYQYAVLNYDKFSQEESPNFIIKLSMEKVDFVILDEIHFTKIRNEEEISQRRKNLDGLMTGIRRKNPNVKVLGLSATPVVNNLREGRSLLELISGKVYDDVAVRPTIPNAVTLYEKLSTISIRELPRYSVDINTHTIDVTAHKPTDISVRHLKSNPLAIEKFLTDARIPEIIKLIDGQTIIYTEYVEDIIQNLSTAVHNAGYSYALYTGFDRSGLSRFLNKKVQVLIASRPISVGVDGLQHICNRLIINTLPWTNAQYQQLIGRLVRKGQIRDVVNVYLVKAAIGGYQYDELKWKRIQFKRTLADCAVDGRLPEKNLVTPQQAAMEAVKWLERLERGEISTVVRRDLNVELTPVEIKKRVIKYGDFTKLNNKINTENSKTTHDRMLSDPKEWEEYHRQYREARKTWSIVPYEEIIKRIRQLSPRLIIGDFGCGEAKILEAFGDNRVYSFDHVAINNKVKACDMNSVPLPDEAIDIGVFSLSLMGRNWGEYIAEAKRCLATNGYLLIAETTKAIKGRLSNIKQVIEQQGFDIYNIEERGDFTFIEAREL
jgi:superfamily II DNA or RNA helicase